MMMLGIAESYEKLARRAEGLRFGATIRAAPAALRAMGPRGSVLPSLTG
jgi:hypothetical protein